MKRKSSFNYINLNKESFAIMGLLSVSILLNGQSKVTIEEKQLIIPTYEVGQPDKNPIFFSGRNYQGAQGHVYPHPMYDVLSDVKKDHGYKAIYLENEFVELCILPELGGRIFSAMDKTDKYDFFYRQHVIKPALIGMTGAWISGGVEWNIPDHHRATSQLPIDYTMVENPDGSKTAWVGETELSRGLKWTVGLTVYPGKSYVEATVKVFNPTPFLHSFLYWANVSVHCNENYQVIFPPSTQFGVQHAKGEFTTWPIGSGYYGGIDRTGVDLSWWKNHPNPASIFARNFTDNFLAGYDFGKDAGTVHVANHHVVTGKKFFLWGNNEESKMWEKMLTETDGQYLELMVGAYSDNQPDYSWIAPGETRVFTQSWYPIKKIGGVKNANTEAAVNLERKTPGTIFVGFNTTSIQKMSKVVIEVKNKLLAEQVIDIDPSNPFVKEYSVNSDIKDSDIKVSLKTADNHELISYSPQVIQKEEMPTPIEVPKAPKEYKSVEELYLTGLRIEQFRNALIDPIPYYTEALIRDSLDYRVNTILGIRNCKEGRYKTAEEYLRRAILRSTKNYTRPKDGEAFYYLGVTLQMQERAVDAAPEFWKATWYSGFQAPAYFRLAQLACKKNNYTEALPLINQAISSNSLYTEALNLKAYILRKTGDYKGAAEVLAISESIDKLDNWTAAERYFTEAAILDQKYWNEKSLVQFKAHIMGNEDYILELANKYGNIGAYEEAITVLAQFRKLDGKQSGFPLLYYYSGVYYSKSGKKEEAAKYFRLGSEVPSDYCFPSRLEDMEILELAVKENPKDAKAWYYLGNLHYFLTQKENAIIDWEQSVKLDEKFATAWRNLGFAYDKVRNDRKNSIIAYEKAILLNDRDPRLFAEIDVIKQNAGFSPSERLSFLQKHLEIIEMRDDAVTRLIELYNLTGNYDKALAILTKRHFHVWEGNGSIHEVFEDANMLQGIRFLEKKQYSKALESFERAATYPYNLEVGNPGYNSENTRINYFIALAYVGLDKSEKANDCFKKVAQYQNRWNQNEFNFYKAMALKKQGKYEEGDTIFAQIRNFALAQLKTTEKTDFFAKFGNDNRMESRMAYNYYLLGLAYLGEGKTQLANENFSKSVMTDQSQLWARVMQQLKINL